VTVDAINARRFDVGREIARALDAVVLLKGVPTVVTAPSGDCLVSAAGTPVLAAAGSGDVLGGIALTWLAQSGDPFVSGAGAAWVHGRAAELANTGRPARGLDLGDVLEALRDVWRFHGPMVTPPVLVELPAVGDGGETVHRVDGGADAR
jgi:NAD(P)H-hydrate repair Nnr-like enzyme with NAD(P)H-hydrate dehydratase domain